MKKWQLYRGLEDPISGTFNLAEEITERSEKILFLSKFALYFVWFSILLDLLLMLTLLSTGQLFLFLVLLSLFITGLITARLLSILRKFLKEAIFRHSAIKAMREGPPAYSIPKGKNKTERFISYLKRNNETFARMLKFRPELLRKDSYAVGKKGKRFHFDGFVHRKPSFLHKLLKIGYPGYSLYIRELKKIPQMSDLKEVIRDLESVTANGGAYPHRICLLYKARSSYNGLNEDLYDKLTSGEVWLKGYKNMKINMQVVVELPTGHYEFVPFVPELPKVLP